jgi:hypothetical protein
MRRDDIPVAAQTGQKIVQSRYDLCALSATRLTETERTGAVCV